MKRIPLRVKILILFCLFVVLSSCHASLPPLPVIRLSEGARELMKGNKNYWIEVQIPQRRLVLAKGLHMIKSFPVAVGMPDYPTPVGSRDVNRIVWNPWWYPPSTSDWVEDTTPVPPRSQGNPLGEIKMPLGSAYLIHGTSAINSIGRWASHGCVRMLFEDIFALSQLLLTEYSNTTAVEAMEKANKDKTREFSTPLKKNIQVVLTYETVKVYDDYVTISPDFYRREKKMAEHIATVVTPYLKKKEQPSLRKIKTVLRAYGERTIHIPLREIIEKSDEE